MDEKLKLALDRIKKSHAVALSLLQVDRADTETEEAIKLVEETLSWQASKIEEFKKELMTSNVAIENLRTDLFIFKDKLEKAESKYKEAENKESEFKRFTELISKNSAGYSLHAAEGIEYISADTEKMSKEEFQFIKQMVEKYGKE